MFQPANISSQLTDCVILLAEQLFGVISFACAFAALETPSTSYNSFRGGTN
jgi:hypothetical protein